MIVNGLDSDPQLLLLRRRLTIGRESKKKSSANFSPHGSRRQVICRLVFTHHASGLYQQLFWKMNVGVSSHAAIVTQIESPLSTRNPFVTITAESDYIALLETRSTNC
jgi:hypothetical protein